MGDEPNKAPKRKTQTAEQRATKRKEAISNRLQMVFDQLDRLAELHATPTQVKAIEESIAGKLDDTMSRLRYLQQPKPSIEMPD